MCVCVCWGIKNDPYQDNFFISSFLPLITTYLCVCVGEREREEKEEEEEREAFVNLIN